MNQLKTLLTLLICSFLVSSQGQTSVMTYNIRYDNPNDGDNWWEKRKTEVAQLIQFYQPDFLGIQEGLVHQVKFLDTQLPSHAYIGVGRDDGKEKGEYAALYYDTTKFELIQSKTFWLSPTPDKVSVGWDAALERVVTYGAFKHKKTAEALFVFNAHFDHKGKVARAESAKLIVEKIKALGLSQKKLIVMGDLNCLPTEEPIQAFLSLLDDSAQIAQKPFYGPIGTYNGFDPNRILERRIDYVLTKNVVVTTYRHIDDRRQNGLCVSDHLPVLVKIK